MKTLKSAYTHLVQVRTGDGAAVTVKPDEKGTYTVTGVSDNVTILVTSVLKGDVDGDGKVNSTDALRALYISTGRLTPDLYQLLAGDVDANGAVNSSDSLNILYFSTGRITQFE